MKKLPHMPGEPTVHRFVSSDPPESDPALSKNERDLISAWKDRKLLMAIIGLATAFCGAATAVIAMRKPAVDATDKLLLIQDQLKQVKATVDSIQTEQQRAKERREDDRRLMTVELDAVKHDVGDARTRLMVLEGSRR